MLDPEVSFSSSNMRQIGALLFCTDFNGDSCVDGAAFTCVEDSADGSAMSRCAFSMTRTLIYGGRQFSGRHVDQLRGSSFNARSVRGAFSRTSGRSLPLRLGCASEISCGASALADATEDQREAIAEFRKSDHQHFAVNIGWPPR
jgi:hypothetical protein